MELTDLSKDLRRLLLTHWKEEEINDRLRDPDYFFDQVVAPRLDYLRRNGEYVPRLRKQRLATGELRVWLS